jgi:hypothetical protein
MMDLDKLQDTLETLTTSALATLQEILTSSQSEKMKVEAAKAILSKVLPDIQIIKNIDKGTVSKEVMQTKLESLAKMLEVNARIVDAQKVETVDAELTNKS